MIKTITKESSYHFLYSKVELKGNVSYPSIKLILTEDQLYVIFLEKKKKNFPAAFTHVLIEKLIFLGICLKSHLLIVTYQKCAHTNTLPCFLTALALPLHWRSNETKSKKNLGQICVSSTRVGKRHMPISQES